MLTILMKVATLIDLGGRLGLKLPCPNLGQFHWAYSIKRVGDQPSAMTTRPHVAGFRFAQCFAARLRLLMSRSDESPSAALPPSERQQPRAIYRKRFLFSLSILGQVTDI
jgi:hypothetical protein